MKNRFAITALNFVRACAVPIAMLVAVSLVAQTAPYDSAKPLPHATLFVPGIISTGDYESHATLTPDGREIYFLKMAPNFSRWTIFVSRYKDGGWAQPEVALFSGQYQDADPYISADGKHFYFISDRPVEKDGERQSHHDIWVMDKTESGLERTAAFARVGQQRCRRVLPDGFEERDPLLRFAAEGSQRAGRHLSCGAAARRQLRGPRSWAAGQ